MEIQTPYVATIIGKVDSGKSTVVKYLIYNHQAKPFYERFEIIMVCSKTKFNHAYDFVPKEWVHSRYNKRAISNLMKIQASARDQGFEPLPACIIFDDCLNAGHYKTEFFTDLVSNRRHYNISIIFCTQFLNTQIPTLMRENSDLVFVFKQFTKPSLKGVYDAWGILYFDGWYEYLSWMKDLKRYCFILIDTREEDLEKSKSIARCPAEIPTPKVRYIRQIPLEKLRTV